MSALAFSLRTGATLHLREIPSQDFAMPSQNLISARRHIVTSIIVGPLAGGFVAYVVLVAYAYFFPSFPTQFEAWGWLQTILLVPPAGYIFGLVPSLIAGVVNAGVARGALGLTSRLILAAPFGVAATFICWGWLVLSMPNYNVGVLFVMFAAAGALGTPFAVWVASRPRRNAQPQVLA